MERYKIFTYCWHVEDNKYNEDTIIRTYGLNDKNENVCLRINNFTPFCFIELPTNIEWTEDLAIILHNKIADKMGEYKPRYYSLHFKKRLYYAYFDTKGHRKKYPYLFLAFPTKECIKQLSYKIKNGIFLPGQGKISLKLHENNADEILQLICRQNISTAGWIEFMGKRVETEEKITYCKHEFIVSYKNLRNYESDIVPNPLILCFDIETNSSIPTAFPNYERPEDKIFQISCILLRQGDSETNMDKHLLTLGHPEHDIVGLDTTVYMYDTEWELLEGFKDFINEYNPNIITGFNIFGFDINYMLERSKVPCACYDSFTKMGFLINKPANIKNVSWTSSAYGSQDFEYIDAEGRLFIDLLPIIKRNYKLDTYSLKSVSNYFIGDTKDDLSAQGIFKCYKLGMEKDSNNDFTKKARKAMGLVGKYCIKDSVLVLKLFEKLQVWIDLVEMAKVTNVPIVVLYTQGQQIKVFSQVYRNCMYEDYVVERDGYKVGENEHYTGAHVFDPIVGIHERVIPFDFCLTGDSKISLSNGLSIRLDELCNRDYKLYSYSKDGLIKSLHINGLQDKGVKDVIKLYLKDSRTITCTPDHKIMLEDGTWEEARNTKGKKVMITIDNIYDLSLPDELNWKLIIKRDLVKENDYIFDMKTIESRNKSLAFARILGYLLSDGCIYTNKTVVYTKKCSEVYLGTLIDSKQFIDDIKLFEDLSIKTKYTIYKSKYTNKGITFRVSIPSKLSLLIHNLEDIVIGKRSKQSMKLPKFILDDKCPLSIIREFLGGLFGGDGTAPYYSNNNFNSASLKWTTIENFNDDMNNVLLQIKYLLNKFNINTNISNPILINYKNSIKPRYEHIIYIHKEDINIFSEKIGFRYCINKTCKLSVCNSYNTYVNNIRRQNEFVIDKTNKIIENNIKNTLSRKKGTLKFIECLEIARNELIELEPILHSFSLSSLKDLGYSRGELKRHFDKPRKKSLYKKINFKEYIEEIGGLNWFSYDNLKNTYAVNQEQEYIPCLKMEVIDIRDDGKKNVYDIEVKDTHNFVANGIIAHNCSLYPSTMIANNICWSTLVNDKWITDSLGNKVWKKDENIKDEDCNVFEWWDHVGCEHDKKVYVNRPKHIMCDERKYRFIKHPIGILPKLLKNLLQARSDTKDKLRDIKIKLKSKDVSDIEKKDLSILATILDKRQLALKVSANSAYGALGVQKGMLPLMPGAMCTTAKGREYLLKTAYILRTKYGGELVYGDTDSNYLIFPHMKDKSATEIWEHSEIVAEEVSKYFPEPVSLAFEEKIYWSFLILAKKKYMCLAADKEGNISKKVEKRGCVLVRRDTCKFIQETYEKFLHMIFNGIHEENIKNELNIIIDSLFNDKIDISKFIITKSVKSTNNLEITNITTENCLDKRGNIKKDKNGNIKTRTTCTIGSYKVNILDKSDPNKMKKQLLDKKATTESEFYLRSLPSHIQLSEKMKRRGKPVSSGTRLEYVITWDNTLRSILKDKQWEKIESAEYFIDHKDILKIDYMYYLECLYSSLDEILNVVFTEKDYIFNIYKKKLEELKFQDSLRPKIKFID